MTYNKYYNSIVSQDMMLKAQTSSPHNTPKPVLINLHTSPGGDLDTVLASGGILTMISGQRPTMDSCSCSNGGL